MEVSDPRYSLILDSMSSYLQKSILLSKSNGISITDKGQKLTTRTELKAKALENMLHSQDKSQTWRGLETHE